MACDFACGWFSLTSSHPASRVAYLLTLTSWCFLLEPFVSAIGNYDMLRVTPCLADELENIRRKLHDDCRAKNRTRMRRMTSVPRCHQLPAKAHLNLQGHEG